MPDTSLCLPGGTEELGCPYSKALFIIKLSHRGMGSLDTAAVPESSQECTEKLSVPPSSAQMLSWFWLG